MWASQRKRQQKCIYCFAREALPPLSTEHFRRPHDRRGQFGLFEAAWRGSGYRETSCGRG